MAPNPVKPALRLAIFDLDYTVWRPEMYQLAGAPRLKAIDSFKRNLPDKVIKRAQTTKDGHLLADRHSEVMEIFDGASHALCQINKLRKNCVDIQAAAASKTDEPQYAQICLDHLLLPDGHTLAECFGNRVEISYGSKVRHIERLHRKTKIPYENMCFFDNENWNISDVSRGLPAIKCVYTPNGMTREAWDKTVLMFDMERN